MTISFKCDKVIRSIKNKIVKKGERKSMKKRKYLALLLAAGMIVQTALSTGGVVQVQAAEDTYVKTDELTDNDTAAPKKDSVIPSKNQYEYQKQELAAFCHFGMNTYTGSEWGNGKENPNQFQLTNDFDEETYVKAIHDAGFKKLIITAKHHDGFCIWPSEMTTHDTETAGYEGDVLEELSRACTKYNIDMGLYLSPWDVNSEYYGYKDRDGKKLVGADGQPLNGKTWDQVKQEDALDYNEYYDNQLKEILGNDKYGNNGHFKEVWMDGAKDTNDKSNAQDYDFQRWFKTIQQYEGKASGKYEDDCLLFGAESYTTVRWIGNERGYAAEETWAKSTIDRENNTINSNSRDGYTKGFPNGNQWTVPEADTKITSGWFWGESKKTPLSMEQLAGIYFGSVGHNATLLLNVPPNKQGTVDADILARVAEFGKAVQNTFDKNLAEKASVSATEVRGNSKKYSPENLLDGNDETYWTVGDGTTSGKVLIDLGESKKFDVVSIEEAIQFGQRIGSFKVEYKNGNGEWKTFDQGTTIGAKRLCRKKAVKADKLRITVTAHNQAENKVPILSEIGVYEAAEGFELGTGIPSGLQTKDDRGFTLSSGWHQETNDQMIEGTGIWINGNGNGANAPYAETKFKGTKAWVIGTIDQKHGPADVYIDGKKVASINTYSATRKLGQILYETNTLEDKEHTLKIVNTGSNTQAVGLDAVAYLDNGGKGMVELEKDAYRVNEDTKYPIKLKRVGGTNGELTVQFEVAPGSAYQKHFDADGNMTVTFKDGQEEAEAFVTTKRVKEKEGDVYFSAYLSAPTEDVLLGFITKAKITIADTESYDKQELLDKIKETEKAGYQESLYTTASYKNYVDALKAAKEAAKKANLTQEEAAKACAALDAAIASLTKRSTFSETDRLQFPKVKGRSTTVEAEYFVLDSSKAEKGKEVRIQPDTGASNGAKVGWFEKGNVIKAPFHAEKEGKYTVTVTYQSGRDSGNPNKINWGGTNVDSGSVNVVGKNTQNPVFEEKSFDINVTKAGDGELVLTADASSSPNIDKFVITAKEVSAATYKITATAGEHGKIEGVTGTEVTVEEGASHTFKFVPDENYAVKDVIVDGNSIGAVDSYTFDDVTANGHTIEVQFEKAVYAEDNRFVFPTDGNTKTAEAERFEIHDVKDPTDGEWHCGVTAKDWASGGKIVNAMNKGDTITLYYDAPQTGEYTVTVYYRSGNPQNGLTWAEKDGKIKSGNVTAGAGDSAAATHTTEFTLNVETAGPGCLVFTAPDAKAPQLDKFDIKSPGTPVPPISAVELEAAVEAAKGLDLNDYKDDDAKTAFTAKLAEAEKLLADIAGGSFAGTQDEVNQMAKELKAAQDALNEKEQTPQVNKDTLKEAIGKAEALDLTQYKEEGKAEFNAALQNAKAVLEKADADQDEIDQATLALNTAIQNLKPVDGGSGDGNGEGNGNGSTGGNGNGSGSTGGSGNGSGNAGGNGSTGGSGTGNSAVQTGDSSNLFVYAGTLLLAAAAFVFGFRRRNQEK